MPLFDVDDAIRLAGFEAGLFDDVATVPAVAYLDKMQVRTGVVRRGELAIPIPERRPNRDRRSFKSITQNMSMLSTWRSKIRRDHAIRSGLTSWEILLTCDSLPGRTCTDSDRPQDGAGQRFHRFDFVAMLCRLLCRQSITLERNRASQSVYPQRHVVPANPATNRIDRLNTDLVSVRCRSIVGHKHQCLLLHVAGERYLITTSS